MGPWPYHCASCAVGDGLVASFIDWGAMMRHMTSQHAGGHAVCGGCGYVFGERRDLVMHVCSGDGEGVVSGEPARVFGGVVGGAATVGATAGGMLTETEVAFEKRGGLGIGEGYARDEGLGFRRSSEDTFRRGGGSAFERGGGAGGEGDYEHSRFGADGYRGIGVRQGDYVDGRRRENEFEDRRGGENEYEASRRGHIEYEANRGEGDVYEGDIGGEGEYEADRVEDGEYEPDRVGEGEYDTGIGGEGAYEADGEGDVEYVIERDREGANVDTREGSGGFQRIRNIGRGFQRWEEVVVQRGGDVDGLHDRSKNGEGIYKSDQDPVEQGENPGSTDAPAALEQAEGGISLMWGENGWQVVGEKPQRGVAEQGQVTSKALPSNSQSVDTTVLEDSNESGRGRKRARAGASVEEEEGTLYDNAAQDGGTTDPDRSGENVLNECQYIDENEREGEVEAGASDQQYGCSRCDLVFHTRPASMHHYRSAHPDVENFTCSKCSKQFRSRAHTVQHERSVHSLLSDFKCVLCSKTFSTKFCLLQHVSTVHEGRRDFPCPGCPKLFSQRGNMVTHYRAKHEGTLPYPCTVCQKWFKSNASRNYHMSVTHSRSTVVFVCFKCNGEFYDKADLEKHGCSRPEAQSTVNANRAPAPRSA